MGMFDYKGQFPYSSMIDAAIQKRRLEEEARQQRQRQLMESFANAGTTATNLVQRKRDMAQALALSQDPDVQNYMTGADTQVATVGGRPAQTASYSGSQVSPNVTPAGVDKILPFVQSGKGYDLAKEAKELAYKKSTVQDKIPEYDSKGNFLGYQVVTRQRGGRTLAPTRPPLPRGNGSGGGTGRTPSEEQLRNTAFDNAMGRLKQQFPFGKDQAKAQGVDYDALLEQLADEEYNRLKTGSVSKAAERKKFIDGAIAKGYTPQEAAQLATQRGL